MAIDSYRYLDFLSRQVIKAWVGRERPRPIPWTPLRKPLAKCTVALISTAGIALHGDTPFDQEREQRDPWWGDPSYRVVPHGTTEADVELYHFHIDKRFGKEDLDVVLPTHRLEELVSEGFVGRSARSHYSVMGYILRPQVLEEKTAPAIAARMKEEGVDIAVVVPA